MLNQVTSQFILKSEEVMDSNPDITMWCWRISAGDRRSRKKVVHSSQDWNSDHQDLIDDIWEALTKLESEPVDNAWIELLAKGQSRIFHYDHIELSEPSEAPQMIMPDGKRVGIGDNYSAAVMSTQLTKTNEQLLNLAMGLARMNASLTQKQMDVAIAYTELETEGRIRGEIDNSSNVAEALKHFAPMMNTFLAQMVKARSEATPAEAEAEAEVPEPEVNPMDIPETDILDSQVDGIVSSFEWICKHKSEYLTEDRVNRVIGAFTSTN